MKVAVFGLGYVGTVTAACLAANGHRYAASMSTRPRSVRSARAAARWSSLAWTTWSAGGSRGALRATTSCPDALERRRAVAGLRGHAVDRARRHRPGLHPPGRRRHRRGAAQREPAGPAHRGHPQHGPAGHGRRRGRLLLALDRQPEGHADRYGAAMCPEFLREGSGIADFYDAAVHGDRHRGSGGRGRLVASLFGFLGSRRAGRRNVRAAEALKYACNAFHATKVSFANELWPAAAAARRRRARGDADVRPGHQAQHLAGLPAPRLRVRRLVPAQGPALAAAPGPGQQRRPAAAGRHAGHQRPGRAATCVDRVRGPRSGRDRRAARPELQADTDDLRESPNVELAERLLGKGFDAAHLRPGGATRPPGRREPAATSGPSCRTCGGCSPTTPAGALDGAGSAIVSCDRQRGRRTRCSSPPPRT